MHKSETLSIYNYISNISNTINIHNNNVFIHLIFAFQLN